MRVTRLAIAVAFSLALPSQAAAPKRAAPKAHPAAKEVLTEGVPTPELALKVQALYEGLEYEVALEAVAALLARPDLALPQRLEALRIQGCLIGIVQDPVDAEPVFRTLLRLKPTYELPSDLTPKIISVFRKVQAEERALAEQLVGVERERLLASLELTGRLPKEVQGGVPVPLSFHVKDPSGVVAAVQLPYRRRGEREYSSLALARREGGDWVGSMPADVTASDQGFELEYFVTTADTTGPLVTQGAAASPLTLRVLPGRLLIERPKPVPFKAFVASAGATVVLGLAAATLGILFNFKQAEYRALGQGTGSGAEVVARGREGDRLGVATNVLVISTGVGLVTSALLATFTNFDQAK